MSLHDKREFFSGIVTKFVFKQFPFKSPNGCLKALNFHILETAIIMIYHEIYVVIAHPSFVLAKEFNLHLSLIAFDVFGFDPQVKFLSIG